MGNAATAELRPEYTEGKFDRYQEYAARYDLPLFFSTHGWSHVTESFAQKFPNLTMIIDHLGVSQSPVSPPREDKWDRLPGVLALAKYPNIHVKFSGVPLHLLVEYHSGLMHAAVQRGVLVCDKHRGGCPICVGRNNRSIHQA